MNPMERHAQCFADADGTLSYDGMVARQAELGSAGYLKSKGAADAIMRLIDSRGLAHTPEAIASVVNSAATGLWKPTGEFDAELFDQLTKYADGDVVTKSAFIRFLRDRQAQLDPATRAANARRDYSEISVVQGCPMLSGVRFGISRDQVTDASVDRLFEDFCDPLGLDEKALTLKSLRLFYTDSPAFFAR